MTTPRYKSANVRESLIPEAKKTEAPEEKEKKLGLWDYIKSITSDKNELTNDELRDYEPYMINRWLSIVPHYVPIISMVNNSTFVSNKRMHYQFLLNTIPKKFVRLGKENYVDTTEPKKMKELVLLLSSKLNVGSNDIKFAIHYLGFDAVNKFAANFKMVRN